MEWFGRSTALVAIVGAVVAACGARIPGPDEPVFHPVLWGYVVQIVPSEVGVDTVWVEGATVWTEPQSWTTQSDSTGRWRIDSGIVPGSYRVRAELDTLQGAVRVSAEFREVGPFWVLFGEERELLGLDFDPLAGSGNNVPSDPTVQTCPGCPVE